MQLNITGQHMDVSPALKTHVQQKIKKIEKHFDHVTNAHVILKIEKDNQIAEGKVHVSGNDLFAHSSDLDMYVAIDHMVTKLDTQIIKHKEKLQNRRK